MSEAFDDFVARHAAGVRRTILKITRRFEDAEDLAQDVFLQAWLQRHRFDPSRGTEAAWLTTIARSRTYDHLRSVTRRLALSRMRDPGVGRSPDAFSGTLDQEQAMMVEAALDSLTTSQRVLLTMSYNEELSHAQIASLLQQPLGTVKTHLRQAVRTLRQRTGADGRSGGSGAERAERCSDAADAFTLDVNNERPGAWSMFEPDEGVKRDLRGLRVVAVDDHRGTLDLVSAVLSRFDVETSSHETAGAALKAMEQSWPDVLLADLDMPVDDGYSLLAAARTLGRERPTRLNVVAFTGRTSEQERSRTSIAGFDAYITKPLHPLALLSTVAALGRRVA
ncbi:MAG: sigma-70 family RNA polymerase sigma factor [Acidobacteria bacterium]|nr:sigma-70 family RNA polymerase sigma factor [Acidobacteriota bacterium]